MSRRHGVVAGLALLGLVAGCRSAADAPLSLSGTYVLESINGAALPATAAQGAGNQYIVLADSLQFLPDFKVRRSYTVRWIQASGDTTYSQVWVFPYTVQGSRITMGNLEGCGPLANCVGFESGIVHGSSIFIAARLFWPGEPQFVFALR